MTIDWTKPICIAATDWQEELPAEVYFGKSTGTGNYAVRIDVPHKRRKNSAVEVAGDYWYFYPNGVYVGSDENDGYIRVINKIEKDSKMPTQKSLDEAARLAHFKDWAEFDMTSHLTARVSIEAHALTLDQLHGRVEVSEAERLYREIIGIAYHKKGPIVRKLDDSDLAAIAILEKALADAAREGGLQF